MTSQFYQNNKSFKKLEEGRKDPPPRKEEILLIPSYYDKDGNMLKEVYIGPPERIAKRFSDERLAIKQLRDFHGAVGRARTKAMLKGIESARPLLWECLKKVEYQRKRDIHGFRGCFPEFMKHHVGLAEKSDKDLEGFFQHIDSVVCYFPNERGGK